MSTTTNPNSILFQGLFCKNTKNEVSNGFPCDFRVNRAQPNRLRRNFARRAPAAVTRKMD